MTTHLVNKAAIAHLRSDPVMARLIDRIGPIRHKPRRLPPFESLVHAVIHQQLSGKAAGTILGRFRALFRNGGFPAPEDVLRAPPEALRAAGLSRPKAAYIHGLAERAMAGEIPIQRSPSHEGRARPAVAAADERADRGLTA